MEEIGIMEETGIMEVTMEETGITVVIMEETGTMEEIAITSLDHAQITTEERREVQNKLQEAAAVAADSMEVTMEEDILETTMEARVLTLGSTITITMAVVSETVSALDL